MVRRIVLVAAMAAFLPVLPCRAEEEDLDARIDELIQTLSDVEKEKRADSAPARALVSIGKPALPALIYVLRHDEMRPTARKILLEIGRANNDPDLRARIREALRR